MTSIFLEGTLVKRFHVHSGEVAWNLVANSINTISRSHNMPTSHGQRKQLKFQYIQFSLSQRTLNVIVLIEYVSPQKFKAWPLAEWEFLLKSPDIAPSTSSTYASPKLTPKVYSEDPPTGDWLSMVIKHLPCSKPWLAGNSSILKCIFKWLEGSIVLLLFRWCY